MKYLQIFLFLVFLSCTQNSPAQTVYTTKTGEKYHNATCHYLKNSKKEITLQQAIDFGYEPCSVCKPSLNSKESQKINSLYSSQESANTSQQTATKVTATQCNGKTKSGQRCKRMTKNTSGRCYQH